MTKIRTPSRAAGLVLVTGGSPSSGVGVGAGVGVATGAGVGVAMAAGDGVGAAGVEAPQAGRTTNAPNSTNELFRITPHACPRSQEEKTLENRLGRRARQRRRPLA